MAQLLQEVHHMLLYNAKRLSKFENEEQFAKPC